MTGRVSKKVAEWHAKLRWNDFTDNGRLDSMGGLASRNGRFYDGLAWFQEIGEMDLEQTRMREHWNLHQVRFIWVLYRKSSGACSMARPQFHSLIGPISSMVGVARVAASSGSAADQNACW